ncbi:hypothetical protein [Flavobacterium sp. W20_MBD1_R3]|uniref:hypothetical protein n=1 Tax=Flavobacterium sp. W20_MBD1_R3 TaxID=3240278 RepID=UPI003F930690
MELDKAEGLVKKYLQGETSIDQEKELRDYFLSQNVAPHLKQYISFFKYLAVAKEQQNKQEIPVFDTLRLRKGYKKRNFAGFSIAAAVVVLISVGTYVFYNVDNTNKNKNLGTYENPEDAFRATQKVLSLVSNNINIGIKSVYYIEEYQNVKNRVFVTSNRERKNLKYQTKNKTNLK